jgi:di/tricarboxylate transporter
MEPEILLAAVILGLVLFALVREVASPAAVVIGGLVAFVLTGILSAEQGFAGLSNPATLSVAGLFVVARAARDHGGLDRYVGRLLGDGRSGPRAALLRLLPPVVCVSGAVNNTPLVATAGPIVRAWGERRGVATTHLLIPLSYAAILGGMLTAIGTGPNLVVSGLLEARGEPGLGFFTITAVGLPVAAIGCALIVLLAPRLLPPDRRSPHEHLLGHERDYTIRLRVVGGGPVEGRTVAQAQLRDLPTTYLAGIGRRGRGLPAVASDLELEADDELIFVGQVDDVSGLLATPGLVEAEQPQTELLDGDGHMLTECVLGTASPLVGSTLKSTSFRGRYGGAVVAIHRAGERIEGKLGTVELRAGDALLVLAAPDFADRWAGRSDFSVVVPSERVAVTPKADHRRWIALGSLGGMVVLAASGAMSVLHAILLACSVLVATRTIRFRQALDALDREVLLIVAAAIGLGAGLEASGLSALLAGAIGTVAAGGGIIVAVAAVVIGTMVLTELITNVAAAALMVPIALDLADRIGAEPVGFAVAVAIGASASFLTPIGYQTNTMVYGLGGYRFGDFWRLGLPITATTLGTCLVMVPWVWG